MFERLGSLTYRFRFAVVVAWVAASAAAVLAAPSLATEGQADQAGFLPPWSESVRARDSVERAFPGSTSSSSATLSFARAGGLTDADRAYIAHTAAWVTSDGAPDALRSVVTRVDTAVSRPELAAMLRSADGELELVTVNLNAATADGRTDGVVAALRDRLAATAPVGLRGHVTGTAGISSDYLAAIIRGTDSTTAVTIVLVLVILLVIYRAPLAAMIPLVTISAAFLVTRGTLGILALAGWKLSSLLDTFIVVLVFGVGTDYTIFLISRFREEVGRSDWHAASMVTVRRIGAVIAASAATVIVGLASMAFADFGMIQTTGPALAVAIAVTLVAGLTLAPALLAIFGHYLFWPFHARLTPSDEPGGFFARLAAAVSGRPGLVTVVLLVALALPALGVGQMRTNFDVLAELPASSDARAGFDDVAEHLGRGKIVQAVGVVDAGAGGDLLAPTALARLHDLMVRLSDVPGVSSVTSLVSPNGDGVLPDGLRPSAQLARMASSFTGEGSAPSDPLNSTDLLDPELSEGLEAASAFTAALASAFPDVAVTPRFHAVATALADARRQVDGVREGTQVTTQLRTLAAALRSPATMVGGSGGAPTVIGDYLSELAAAFPSVRGDARFLRARSEATALATGPSIQSALALADALEALATAFEVDPSATLVATSLSQTPQAIAQRREVEATFAELPVAMDALSALFAQRPDDIFVPLGLEGDGGQALADAVEAFVSGESNATRFYLTTVDDPYAPAAFETIRAAQSMLHDAARGFGPSATAFVGGPTAEFADIQAVLGSDFGRVGAITVVGILAVLIVLLRAVVAPLYLVGTVLLSCATAVGLSSWFFEAVLGHPGVSFYLPLLVFVLLVALGSDYNIFLMSRVREENEGRPVRDAIRVASGRTGAVITSAGLILAGTFGSMASAPLVVLFQVGVAVALGVLIDTFVVRSILVPALTTLAGRAAWWPSGLGFDVSWLRRVLVPAQGGGGGAPVAGASGTASPATTAAVLTMVLLLPTAFAGLFVASLGDPTGHLDGVTAAVVDEDRGATLPRPDGSTERLQVGAGLAQRLTGTTRSDDFTWRLTDVADAAAGLADGRYGAVLTIPADFSASIARIRLDQTGQASRAQLRLATNDGTSYALGTIARSVSGAITSSTSGSVTSRYLDDVLVAVTVAHDDLVIAGQDAGRLVDDAMGLGTRAADVSAVAGQLVVGLDELAAGTSPVGEGANALVGAVGDVATGSARLAAGAAELAAGAGASAEGAERIAAGAASLAAGLGPLSAGAETLVPRAVELAGGAAEVASGAEGLADGAESLADALAALRSSTVGLGAQTASLHEGAVALSAGGDVVAGGAAASSAVATSLATGAETLRVSVAAYAGSVASLAGDCEALGGGAAVCLQLRGIAAANGGLNAAAAGVATGATELAASAGAVASGAVDLASAARSVAIATEDLAMGAPSLEGGIAAAAVGGESLRAGTSALGEGARGVAMGTRQLAEGLPALSEGTARAAAGASGLAVGAGDLSGGMARVAEGAEALASGARVLATATAELSRAADLAGDGAASLADALASARDGGSLVAAGIAAVAADAADLTKGTEGLVVNLEAAAEETRTYAPAVRRALGDMAANPVAIEAERLNALADGGDGLAPYFMALSLWVGALALFLALPAAFDTTARRRPLGGSLVGFAVASGIGLVQAGLMVGVLVALVGTDVARLPELLGLVTLAMLTAIALVQALVTVFGTRGWFVALFFVVLQLTSAGAPYPIETAPTLFQVLHPLLPMSYAVEGFGALVAGGGWSLAPAVLVLFGWLVGALGVTVTTALYRVARRPLQHPGPA